MISKLKCTLLCLAVVFNAQQITAKSLESKSFKEKVLENKKQIALGALAFLGLAIGAYSISKAVSKSNSASKGTGTDNHVDNILVLTPSAQAPRSDLAKTAQPKAEDKTKESKAAKKKDKKRLARHVVRAAKKARKSTKLAKKQEQNKRVYKGNFPSSCKPNNDDKPEGGASGIAVAILVEDEKGASVQKQKFASKRNSGPKSLRKNLRRKRARKKNKLYNKVQQGEAGGQVAFAAALPVSEEGAGEAPRELDHDQIEGEVGDLKPEVREKPEGTVPYLKLVVPESGKPRFSKKDLVGAIKALDSALKQQEGLKSSGFGSSSLPVVAAAAA